MKLGKMRVFVVAQGLVPIRIFPHGSSNNSTPNYVRIRECDKKRKLNVASEVADTFETWIRVHRGMLRHRERKEHSPICHFKNCHS